MDNINNLALRRLDLNTLVVLHTLLQTQSVSLSAQRLFIGQPAISHILKRLRAHFDDQLLCRSGRKMELTPLAAALKPALYDWLQQAQQLFLPQGHFDPASAEATLRLTMPDLLEAGLLPSLIQALQARAPGISAEILAMQGGEVEQALADGRIDVAVGYFPRLSPMLERIALFDASFVAVHDPRQLTLPDSPSLATLAQVPHIAISYAGNSVGIIDRRLKQLGLSRRIIASGASLLAIPAMLECVPAVALLPDVIRPQLQTAYPELTVAEIQDARLSIPIELVWHPRLGRDPLQCFARGLLAQQAGEIFAG